MHATALNNEVGKDWTELLRDWGFGAIFSYVKKTDDSKMYGSLMPEYYVATR